MQALHRKQLKLWMFVLDIDGCIIHIGNIVVNRKLEKSITLYPMPNEWIICQLDYLVPRIFIHASNAWDLYMPSIIESFAKIVNSCN